MSTPIKARLKRLAILANPEFHRKEAMRLSVSGTPRVIRCFEEDEQWLSIPRGCKVALEKLARDLDIALDWEDQTLTGKPLETTFRGELRDGQAEAVAALEGQVFGILSAPPGSGKTVMAASLIARRKVNTLILVHRQPLVDQWKSRLSNFLGLDPKEIGTISGGKSRRNGSLDVAMVQSLMRDSHVEDWISEYGMVIVDECHHVPRDRCCAHRSGRCCGNSSPVRGARGTRIQNVSNRTRHAGAPGRRVPPTCSDRTCRASANPRSGTSSPCPGSDRPQRWRNRQATEGQGS
ncbi:MAG: DEAD/DEAH box helicase family protein [Fibrobacteres bacterium]|nr:DEAD/DEAH box helicase family protein [Fibrobacterota bacterium]